MQATNSSKANLKIRWITLILGLFISTHEKIYVSSFNANERDPLN